MWKLLHEYGYYPIVHHSAKARSVTLVHVCVYIVTTRPFILFSGQPPHLPFRRFLNSYAGAWCRYRIHRHESQGNTATTSLVLLFFAWTEYEATATCKTVHVSIGYIGLHLWSKGVKTEVWRLVQTQYKSSVSFICKSLLLTLEQIQSQNKQQHPHQTHLGHKTSHPLCSGHDDPIATYGQEFIL